MGRWTGAHLTQTRRRIGLLGGTFDPVHRGHLHAADAAAGKLGLDRVVFVPAGRPWQKDGYAHAEDRYYMTVLATAGDPRFAVSRTEIDRPGETYTVDTLELWRTFYGVQIDLYLIVGSDAAVQLHTWHRAGEVAGLARIAVIARPRTDLERVKAANPGVPLEIIEAPEVDVSATEVRRRGATGDVEDDLVPEVVASYIRSHGLYERRKDGRS